MVSSLSVSILKKYSRLIMDYSLPNDPAIPNPKVISRLLTTTVIFIALLFFVASWQRTFEYGSLRPLAGGVSSAGDISYQPNSIASASVLPASDPLIVAAGDIACTYPSTLACQQKSTAALIQKLVPTAVLALGDTQYETGALSDYAISYNNSWGEFKNITHPTPGNHEYLTLGASGYFDYFDGVGKNTGPAGERGRGYYSFNIGAWHAISLNANCSQVGGCGPDSPQNQWLKNDLASNSGVCTLAFWHQPKFSSGQHGGSHAYDTFWNELYSYHADLVLNGHDHDYERFAKQDPHGSSAQSAGIREFVVGTGGGSLRNFGVPQPNSQFRQSGKFGVLLLTLKSNSYDWRFVSVDGKEVDSGSDTCNVSL